MTGNQYSSNEAEPSFNSVELKIFIIGDITIYRFLKKFKKWYHLLKSTIWITLSFSGITRAFNIDELPYARVSIIFSVKESKK